ncbi:hypothetical protein V6N13_145442 [Hibiscus sabdariffa]
MPIVPFATTKRVGLVRDPGVAGFFSDGSPEKWVALPLLFLLETEPADEVELLPPDVVVSNGETGEASRSSSLKSGLFISLWVLSE